MTHTAQGLSPPDPPMTPYLSNRLMELANGHHQRLASLEMLSPASADCEQQRCEEGETGGLERKEGKEHVEETKERPPPENDEEDEGVQTDVDSTLGEHVRTKKEIQPLAHLPLLSSMYAHQLPRTLKTERSSTAPSSPRSHIGEHGRGEFCLAEERERRRAMEGAPLSAFYPSSKSTGSTHHMISGTPLADMSGLPVATASAAASRLAAATRLFLPVGAGVNGPHSLALSAAAAAAAASAAAASASAAAVPPPHAAGFLPLRRHDGNVLASPGSLQLAPFPLFLNSATGCWTFMRPMDLGKSVVDMKSTSCT
ncbi:uncharacterized protein [Diadema antillarum]|uniref:uncharacterized protein n=1 Tax=Diadema antillarum TaxID=105358 RepID=UPI003A8C81AF